MVTKRVWIIVATTLVCLLAAATSTTPVRAAVCALSAPAYVNVGTPLSVTGTGFPASANVDITITVGDGSPDEFSIQSDEAGTLEIVSTPETLDIGVTTVQATSGASCTALVTYTVLAAGATPPPATPAPTDDAGTAGAGDSPGAPRTDAEGLGSTDAGLGTWALALALVAIGGASLFLTRSPRRR